MGHTYHYEKIVIGHTLDAIIHANKTSSFFIRNSMDGIFPFDEISDDVDLGKLKYQFKKNLFNHLLYKLAMQGKVPFGDMVEAIRIDEDEKLLHIITSRGSKITATYNEIRLFDIEKINSPIFDVKNIELYRVFDWYDVKSGLKHEHDFLSSEDNFCKNIYFYMSKRITGNPKKGLKDLVVESILTKKQLHNTNYSDTMSRFKTISMMKEAGIKGRANGSGRYLAIKLELNRREILPIIPEMFEDRGAVVLDNRGS